MITCIVAASCRPLVTETAGEEANSTSLQVDISKPSLPPETAGEKSDSEGSKEQVGVSKRVLSKEQIIEIAKGEARRHGWNPERWVTIYDDGNAHWESWLSILKAPGPPLKPVPPPPALEGRDHQVVIYRRKEIAPSQDLKVMVDRNTEEVLYVMPGPPEMP